MDENANDPYMIISSDCHAGLPNAEYRDWLDPEYRDAFDTHLTERTRMLELAQRGILNEEFAAEWEEENAEGLRGGWDSTRRDKELDADGVVGEVIFPDADAVTAGASAPFGAGLSADAAADPALLMAGARAHNRWLAELCTASDSSTGLAGRRAGVAVVPIFDVNAAVTEVTRARESGLWGGVLIPSMWGKYPPYHDASYDPFWAACQGLKMPVHVHSGAADKNAYGPHVGIYTTEVRWWSSRPLWFLIWSGVFERFPDLRFVVTECGAFWAADLLWMMDTVFDREHGSRKLGKQLTAQLSRRPSEVFDTNCAIGASNTRRRELARRYEIGVGNLMWGNDFPHPEGTWPHTREWLQSAFHDIPVAETRAILGTNTAAIYGFDVEALAPLAARVGPTPSDLGQTGESDGKWAALAEAGRSWLTGVEAVPVTLAEAD
jgi:predicted TIM-barrel fold metal-dependent hydrolase